MNQRNCLKDSNIRDLPENQEKWSVNFY